MNEVRVAFKAEPIPVPGAAVDLVYHPPVLSDDPMQAIPEWWTIRMYRDNLRKFSGTEQETIAHWVFRAMERCCKHGNVLPEVLEKEPIS